MEDLEHPLFDNTPLELVDFICSPPVFKSTACETKDFTVFGVELCCNL